MYIVHTYVFKNINTLFTQLSHKTSIQWSWSFFFLQNFRLRLKMLKLPFKVRFVFVVFSRELSPETSLILFTSWTISMKLGEHIRLGLIRQPKVTKFNFTAWEVPELNGLNLAWKLYWNFRRWYLLNPWFYRNHTYIFGMCSEGFEYFWRSV